MRIDMEQILDMLANKYGTDKGSRYDGPSKHGYASIYENYLHKWKNSPIRMLEVGVCMEFTTGGHSIYMWSEYFPHALLYTFDIVDMSHHPAVTGNHRVSFYQGDQGNRKDFESMYETFGNSDFDFILEDGSHQHEHQMISLAALFKYVKSGGYYILEDMSIPDHPVCCIRNDETYQIISQFKNTGKLVSNHLTEEEIKYLEENISSIEIHHDIQDAYAVTIITKR